MAKINGKQYKKVVAKRKAVPVPKSDPIRFIQCLDCGNEQADMGRNVACENCGARMPE